MNRHKTHVLERTSPVEAPFLGRCVLCEEEDLGVPHANDPCTDSSKVGDILRALPARLRERLEGK